MTSTAEIFDQVKYCYSRYVVKNSFEISEHPHLDEQLLSHLTGQLRDCQNYLEYGAGGSTFLALRNVQGLVLSVDNDPMYLEAIRKRVSLDNSRSERFKPIQVNTGLTAQWGRPVSLKKANWSRYAKAPWDNFPDIIPDVVFIDGRFRVACALESISRLPCNWEGRIIIDDYIERPFYKEVEKYALEYQYFGRGISLKPDFSLKGELPNILEKYYRDHR